MTILYVIFVLFQGELVWFDPGVGHVLPGEVLEYHKPAQVLTVQAVIAGKVSTKWNVYRYDNIITLLNITDSNILANECQRCEPTTGSWPKWYRRHDSTYVSDLQINSGPWIEIRCLGVVILH